MDVSDDPGEPARPFRIDTDLSTLKNQNPVESDHQMELQKIQLETKNENLSVSESLKGNRNQIFLFSRRSIRSKLSFQRDESHQHQFISKPASEKLDYPVEYDTQEKFSTSNLKNNRERWDLSFALNDPIALESEILKQAIEESSLPKRIDKVFENDSRDVNADKLGEIQHDIKEPVFRQEDIKQKVNKAEYFQFVEFREIVDEVMTQKCLVSSELKSLDELYQNMDSEKSVSNASKSGLLDLEVANPQQNEMKKNEKRLKSTEIDAIPSNEALLLPKLRHVEPGLSVTKVLQNYTNEPNNKFWGVTLKSVELNSLSIGSDSKITLHPSGNSIPGGEGRSEVGNISVSIGADCAEEAVENIMQVEMEDCHEDPNSEISSLSTGFETLPSNECSPIPRRNLKDLENESCSSDDDGADVSSTETTETLIQNENSAKDVKPKPTAVDLVDYPNLKSLNTKIKETDAPKEIAIKLKPIPNSNVEGTGKQEVVKLKPVQMEERSIEKFQMKLPNLRPVVPNDVEETDDRIENKYEHPIETQTNDNKELANNNNRYQLYPAMQRIVGQDSNVRHTDEGELLNILKKKTKKKPDIDWDNLENSHSSKDTKETLEKVELKPVRLNDNNSELPILFEPSKLEPETSYSSSIEPLDMNIIEIESHTISHVNPENIRAARDVKFIKHASVLAENQDPGERNKDGDVEIDVDVPIVKMSCFEEKNNEYFEKSLNKDEEFNLVHEQLRSVFPNDSVSESLPLQKPKPKPEDPQAVENAEQSVISESDREKESHEPEMKRADFDDGSETGALQSSLQEDSDEEISAAEDNENWQLARDVENEKMSSGEETIVESEIESFVLDFDDDKNGPDKLYKFSVQKKEKSHPNEEKWTKVAENKKLNVSKIDWDSLEKSPKIERVTKFPDVKLKSVDNTESSEYYPIHFSKTRMKGENKDKIRVEPTTEDGVIKDQDTKNTDSFYLEFPNEEELNREISATQPVYETKVEKDEKMQMLLSAQGENLKKQLEKIKLRPVLTRTLSREEPTILSLPLLEHVTPKDLERQESVADPKPKGELENPILIIAAKHKEVPIRARFSRPDQELNPIGHKKSHEVSKQGVNILAEAMKKLKPVEKVNDDLKNVKVLPDLQVLLYDEPNHNGEFNSSIPTSTEKSDLKNMKDNQVILNNSQNVIATNTSDLNSSRHVSKPIAEDLMKAKQDLKPVILKESNLEKEAPRDNKEGKHLSTTKPEKKVASQISLRTNQESNIFSVKLRPVERNLNAPKQQNFESNQISKDGIQLFSALVPDSMVTPSSEVDVIIPKPYTIQPQLIKYSNTGNKMESNANKQSKRENSENEFKSKEPVTRQESSIFPVKLKPVKKKDNVLDEQKIQLELQTSKTPKYLHSPEVTDLRVYPLSEVEAATSAVYHIEPRANSEVVSTKPFKKTESNSINLTQLKSGNPDNKIKSNKPIKTNLKSDFFPVKLKPVGRKADITKEQNTESSPIPKYRGYLRPADLAIQSRIAPSSEFQEASLKYGLDEVSNNSKRSRQSVNDATLFKSEDPVIELKSQIPVTSSQKYNIFPVKLRPVQKVVDVPSQNMKSNQISENRIQFLSNLVTDSKESSSSEIEEVIPRVLNVEPNLEIKTESKANAETMLRLENLTAPIETDTPLLDIEIRQTDISTEGSDDPKLEVVNKTTNENQQKPSKVSKSVIRPKLEKSQFQSVKLKPVKLAKILNKPGENREKEQNLESLKFAAPTPENLNSVNLSEIPVGPNIALKVKNTTDVQSEYNGNEFQSIKLNPVKINEEISEKNKESVKGFKENVQKSLNVTSAKNQEHILVKSPPREQKSLNVTSAKNQDHILVKSPPREQKSIYSIDATEKQTKNKISSLKSKSVKAAKNVGEPIKRVNLNLKHVEAIPKAIPVSKFPNVTLRHVAPIPYTNPATRKHQVKIPKLINYDHRETDTGKFDKQRTVQEPVSQVEDNVVHEKVRQDIVLEKENKLELAEVTDLQEKCSLSDANDNNFDIVPDSYGSQLAQDQPTPFKGTTDTLQSSICDSFVEDKDTTSESQLTQDDEWQLVDDLRFVNNKSPCTEEIQSEEDLDNDLKKSKTSGDVYHAKPIAVQDMEFVPSNEDRQEQVKQYLRSNSGHQTENSDDPSVSEKVYLVEPANLENDLIQEHGEVNNGNNQTGLNTTTSDAISASKTSNGNLRKENNTSREIFDQLRNRTSNMKQWMTMNMTDELPKPVESNESKMTHKTRKDDQKLRKENDNDTTDRGMPMKVQSQETEKWTSRWYHDETLFNVNTGLEMDRVFEDYRPVTTLEIKDQLHEGQTSSIPIIKIAPKILKEASIQSSHSIEKTQIADQMLLDFTYEDLGFMLDGVEHASHCGEIEVCQMRIISRCHQFLMMATKKWTELSQSNEKYIPIEHHNLVTALTSSEPFDKFHRIHTDMQMIQNSEIESTLLNNQIECLPLQIRQIDLDLNNVSVDNSTEPFDKFYKVNVSILLIQNVEIESTLLNNQIECLPLQIRQIDLDLNNFSVDNSTEPFDKFYKVNVSIPLIQNVEIESTLLNNQIECLPLQIRQIDLDLNNFSVDNSTEPFDKFYKVNVSIPLIQNVEIESTLLNNLIECFPLQIRQVDLDLNNVSVDNSTEPFDKFYKGNVSIPLIQNVEIESTLLNNQIECLPLQNRQIDLALNNVSVDISTEPFDKFYIVNVSIPLIQNVEIESTLLNNQIECLPLQNRQIDLALNNVSVDNSTEPFDKFYKVNVSIPLIQNVEIESTLLNNQIECLPLQIRQIDLALNNVSVDISTEPFDKLYKVNVSIPLIQNVEIESTLLINQIECLPLQILNVSIPLIQNVEIESTLSIIKLNVCLYKIRQIDLALNNVSVDNSTEPFDKFYKVNVSIPLIQNVEIESTLLNNQIECLPLQIRQIDLALNNPFDKFYKVNVSIPLIQNVEIESTLLNNQIECLPLQNRQIDLALNNVSVDISTEPFDKFYKVNVSIPLIQNVEIESTLLNNQIECLPLQIRQIDLALNNVSVDISTEPFDKFYKVNVSIPLIQNVEIESTLLNNQIECLPLQNRQIDLALNNVSVDNSTEPFDKFYKVNVSIPLIQNVELESTLLNNQIECLPLQIRQIDLALNNVSVDISTEPFDKFYKVNVSIPLIQNVEIESTLLNNQIECLPLEIRQIDLALNNVSVDNSTEPFDKFYKVNVSIPLIQNVEIESTLLNNQIECLPLQIRQIDLALNNVSVDISTEPFDKFYKVNVSIPLIQNVEIESTLFNNQIECLPLQIRQIDLTLNNVSVDNSTEPFDKFYKVNVSIPLIQNVEIESTLLNNQIECLPLQIRQIDLALNNVSVANSSDPFGKFHRVHVSMPLIQNIDIESNLFNNQIECLPVQIRQIDLALNNVSVDNSTEPFGKFYKVNVSIPLIQNVEIESTLLNNQIECLPVQIRQIDLALNNVSVDNSTEPFDKFYKVNVSIPLIQNVEIESTLLNNHIECFPLQIRQIDLALNNVSVDNATEPFGNYYKVNVSTPLIQNVEIEKVTLQSNFIETQQIDMVHKFFHGDVSFEPFTEFHGIQNDKLFIQNAKIEDLKIENLCLENMELSFSTKDKLKNSGEISPKSYLVASYRNDLISILNLQFTPIQICYEFSKYLNNLSYYLIGYNVSKPNTVFHGVTYQKIGQLCHMFLEDSQEINQSTDFNPNNSSEIVKYLSQNEGRSKSTRRSCLHSYQDPKKFLKVSILQEKVFESYDKENSSNDALIHQKAVISICESCQYQRKLTVLFTPEMYIAEVAKVEFVCIFDNSNEDNMIFDIGFNSINNQDCFKMFKYPDEIVKMNIDSCSLVEYNALIIEKEPEVYCSNIFINKELLGSCRCREILVSEKCLRFCLDHMVKTFASEIVVSKFEKSCQDINLELKKWTCNVVFETSEHTVLTKLNTHRESVEVFACDFDPVIDHALLLAAEKQLKSFVFTYVAEVLESLCVWKDHLKDELPNISRFETLDSTYFHSEKAYHSQNKLNKLSLNRKLLLLDNSDDSNHKFTKAIVKPEENFSSEIIYGPFIDSLYSLNECSANIEGFDQFIQTPRLYSAFRAFQETFACETYNCKFICNAEILESLPCRDLFASVLLESCRDFLIISEIFVHNLFEIHAKKVLSEKSRLIPDSMVLCRTTNNIPIATYTAMISKMPTHTYCCQNNYFHHLITVALESFENIFLHSVKIISYAKSNKEYTNNCISKYVCPSLCTEHCFDSSNKDRIYCAANDGKGVGNSYRYIKCEENNRYFDDKKNTQLPSNYVIVTESYDKICSINKHFVHACQIVLEPYTNQYRCKNVQDFSVTYQTKCNTPSKSAKQTCLLETILMQEDQINVKIISDHFRVEATKSINLPHYEFSENETCQLKMLRAVTRDDSEVTIQNINPRVSKQCKNRSEDGIGLIQCSRTTESDNVNVQDSLLTDQINLENKPAIAGNELSSEKFYLTLQHAHEVFHKHINENTNYADKKTPESSVFESLPLTGIYSEHGSSLYKDEFGPKVLQNYCEQPIITLTDYGAVKLTRYLKNVPTQAQAQFDDPTCQEINQIFFEESVSDKQCNTNEYECGQASIKYSVPKLIVTDEASISLFSILRQIWMIQCDSGGCEDKHTDSSVDLVTEEVILTHINDSILEYPQHVYVNKFTGFESRLKNLSFETAVERVHDCSLTFSHQMTHNKEAYRIKNIIEGSEQVYELPDKLEHISIKRSSEIYKNFGIISQMLTLMHASIIIVEDHKQEITNCLEKPYDKNVYQIADTIFETNLVSSQSMPQLRLAVLYFSSDDLKSQDPNKYNRMRYRYITTEEFKFHENIPIFYDDFDIASTFALSNVNPRNELSNSLENVAWSKSWHIFYNQDFYLTSSNLVNKWSVGYVSKSSLMVNSGEDQIGGIQDLDELQTSREFNFDIKNSEKIHSMQENCEIVECSQIISMAAVVITQQSVLLRDSCEKHDNEAYAEMSTTGHHCPSADSQTWPKISQIMSTLAHTCKNKGNVPLDFDKSSVRTVPSSSIRNAKTLKSRLVENNAKSTKIKKSVSFDIRTYTLGNGNEEYSYNNMNKNVQPRQKSESCRSDSLNLKGDEKSSGVMSCGLLDLDDIIKMTSMEDFRDENKSGVRDTLTLYMSKPVERSTSGKATGSFKSSSALSCKQEIGNASHGDGVKESKYSLKVSQVNQTASQQDVFPVIQILTSSGVENASNVCMGRKSKPCCIELDNKEIVSKEYIEDSEDEDNIKANMKLTQKVADCEQSMIDVSSKELDFQAYDHFGNVSCADEVFGRSNNCDKNEYPLEEENRCKSFSDLWSMFTSDFFENDNRYVSISDVLDFDLNVTDNHFEEDIRSKSTSQLPYTDQEETGSPPPWYRIIHSSKSIGTSLQHVLHNSVEQHNEVDFWENCEISNACDAAMTKVEECLETYPQVIRPLIVLMDVKRWAVCTEVHCEESVVIFDPPEVVILTSCVVTHQPGEPSYHSSQVQSILVDKHTTRDLTVILTEEYFIKENKRRLLPKLSKEMRSYSLEFPGLLRTPGIIVPRASTKTICTITYKKHVSKQSKSSRLRVYEKTQSMSDLLSDEADSSKNTELKNFNRSMSSFSKNNSKEVIAKIISELSIPGSSSSHDDLTFYMYVRNGTKSNPKSLMVPSEGNFARSLPSVYALHLEKKVPPRLIELWVNKHNMDLGLMMLLTNCERGKRKAPEKRVPIKEHTSKSKNSFPKPSNNIKKEVGFSDVLAELLLKNRSLKPIPKEDSEKKKASKPPPKNKFEALKEELLNRVQSIPAHDAYTTFKSKYTPYDDSISDSTSPSPVCRDEILLSSMEKDRKAPEVLITSESEEDLDKQWISKIVKESSQNFSEASIMSEERKFTLKSTENNNSQATEIPEKVYNLVKNKEPLLSETPQTIAPNLVRTECAQPILEQETPETSRPKSMWTETPRISEFLADIRANRHSGHSYDYSLPIGIERPTNNWEASSQFASRSIPATSSPLRAYSLLKSISGTKKPHHGSADSVFSLSSKVPYYDGSNYNSDDERDYSDSVKIPPAMPELRITQLLQADRMSGLIKKSASTGDILESRNMFGKYYASIPKKTVIKTKGDSSSDSSQKHFEQGRHPVPIFSSKSSQNSQHCNMHSSRSIRNIKEDGVGLIPKSKSSSSIPRIIYDDEHSKSTQVPDDVVLGIDRGVQTTDELLSSVKRNLLKKQTAFSTNSSSSLQSLPISSRAFGEFILYLILY
ncbi:putative threonine-rich GPI-anchored glycoprotein [Nymphon striatum]|nr:putative threonine-rich GPI-anchored glycoprotein [Nymphon striatum]